MSKNKLSQFSPQKRNANKHTQRGLGMLESSIQTDGWIGAITTANSGEVIAGSARLEKSATIFGIEAEPIVIEADGTRPIIVKRTDIATADTERAKRLALADNRIAQVDLSWDAEVIGEMLKEADEKTKTLLEGIAISTGLINPVDYEKEWQGMPEFEQEDLGAYKSITIHFSGIEDMRLFAELVGQMITDKTKSIWYPKKERADLKQVVAHEQS